MANTHTSSSIVEALRGKGLRVTPQRVAVYDNLLKRSDHPTVDQIMIDLNHDLPVSSKATIYSTLSSLREAGLVREILLEEGVTRYDSNVGPHHHFRCSSCSSIIDVPWNALNVSWAENLPGGHAISSHEVTIHGICNSCRNAADKGGDAATN
ncbi:MAG: Fur family transcriptional regulator [Cyanobacteria bacterium P01_D01_bin.73]